MANSLRLFPPVLVLAPLAFALGCDTGAAEVVREIDAAREGCTEERLRAGEEECVRMMERYVEMGSEAIATYIGAIRSFDQALQRNPAQMFDTAGLGRAITFPLEGSSGIEPVFGLRPPSPGAGFDYPHDAARSSPPRLRSGDGYADAYRPYAVPPVPDYYRDPQFRSPRDTRYDYHGYRSRDYGGYEEPGYRLPGEPEYDYRGYEDYGYENHLPYRDYDGYRYQDGYRGGYVDPGYPGRGRYYNEAPRVYDERYDVRPDLQRGHRIAPDRIPPSRGQLRPPEERLRRGRLPRPPLDW